MNGSLQRKGSTYYAVISLKDENGKFRPKWVNTKCKGKNDAKKELTRILYEFENRERRNNNDILFADYLEYWLNNIIIHEVEKSTWEGYAYNLRTHICPYFRKLNLRLQDLTTVDLQTYFNEKYKNGRTDGKGGLSANLLHKHRANLKKALDYSIAIGYIKRDPIDHVAMPKIKKFVGKTLTQSEVKKLLQAAKDTTIEAMIVLAVNFGLRRGELLGLRWQDVDFESKSIFITNTRIRVRKTIEKQPKSDASLRTLPLMPKVENYLLKLKAQQEEDRQRLGKLYKDCAYVCRYRNGTPININMCNKTFKKILKESGLPDIRLQDLRHSTASFLLKHGASMKEIQIWLGHADISTAMNIYAHVDFEMMKGAADIINELDFVV